MNFCTYPCFKILTHRNQSISAFLDLIFEMKEILKLVSVRMNTTVKFLFEISFAVVTRSEALSYHFLYEQ